MTLQQHPLRATYTADEWRQLRQDVEFGRISWPIGIEKMKALTIPLLDAVPDSENSREFHAGMVARMEQSYFKYGAVADAVSKNNFIASLKVRLAKYEETGNTEWLMDVANYAMIEFMHPQHDAAHFRATDSDESPGNVKLATGKLSQTANTMSQENMRLGGSALVTCGGFYQREGD